MTAGQYSLLGALIFALVAVLQIVRAVAGLRITIGRKSIPVWTSWVAGGVAIISPGWVMQPLKADLAAAPERRARRLTVTP